MQPSHLALAALSALAPLAGAQSGAAQVGDVVEHVFSAPPVNALGVAKISDLRGKPVLIEFWGST